MIISEQIDEVDEKNAELYFNDKVVSTDDTLTEEEAESKGYILGCGDFIRNPLCRSLGLNDPRAIAKAVKTKDPSWVARVQTKSNAYGVITKYKQEALDFFEEQFANMQNEKTRSTWKAIQMQDITKYNDRSSHSLLYNVCDLSDFWGTDVFYSYISEKYRLNKRQIAALKTLLKR